MFPHLPAPLLPGAPPMTMQTRTLALAGAILLLSACGNGAEAGPGGAAGQMPPPQVGVVVAKQTTVPLTQEMVESGRAYVWTPVTNAHLVCCILLEKKNGG